MIDRLVDYVRGIHHTIRKEDILKGLDTTMTGISVDVIPTLDMLIKNSDLKVISDSKILRNAIAISGFKSNDNKSFLIKIKSVMSNIGKSNKNLEKVITEGLNDVITDKTINVREGAIIKVVSDISALSLFIMDFSYLVLLDGKSDNTDLPKMSIEKVKSGSVTFANSLKAYGNNFSKTVSNLAKLPDNSLYVEDNKISLLTKLVGKNSKLVDVPNTSGFIGNPIYSIKMWLVDREVAKYEALKEKRKLIELKLVELKLNEEDESNPSLVKQIEYYENKLSRIEYEIAQTEDDDED